MNARIFVCFALAGGCGTTPPDDPMPATWTSLITKSWTLAPNSEKTGDLQLVDVDQDIYIAGLRPLSPPGTHHTLLARGTDFNSGNFVYASALGTNEIVFPPGVGLHLAAGSLLALQLHIFNSSDTELTGTSGIEYLPLDPSKLVHEADLFLPGPKDFEIAQGRVTASGTCTVTAPQTLFALFPHMHQLGAHLTTTVVQGGVAKTIHDADFDFSAQSLYPLDTIELTPGDTITTECTWVNPTANIVRYGESTTTEMCYSIAFRYPTQPESFCTQ